jgi:hypothetical protein
MTACSATWRGGQHVSELAIARLQWKHGELVD